MAQNAGTDAAFISAAYKPYNFDFLAEANIPKHPHVSLFKQIDVVDYRHDTTRIGFFNNAAHGKRQIIANPQTADGIATYLNKSYAHPLGNFSLLVVIRKFWLSDIAQERETAEQVELKPASSSIRIRAEAYVNDVSGYIPLGFLDTTITATRSLMAIAPFRLPLLFDALMN